MTTGTFPYSALSAAGQPVAVIPVAEVTVDSTGAAAFLSGLQQTWGRDGNGNLSTITKIDAHGNTWTLTITYGAQGISGISQWVKS